jgi:predicted O-methyltransferase YrrM
VAELIAPQTAAYIESLVPERPAELLAMEAYAREKSFPIIGPACGHLCYQIARMQGARDIFELGSGFGYSTAFFAKAVAENGGGVVHHVVWDDDLSSRARGHIKALGLERYVEFHVAEAVGQLSKAAGPFDIIFNDIDKHGYPASLPVIEQKLRTGGTLIIDNMLWSGRIFDPADTSKNTEGVREFTRQIRSNANWITSLIPIRDGMIVALRQ